MADVEDVASDIDIESYDSDSPVLDPGGALGEVPVVGSGIDAAGSAFGAGQSVAGLISGGDSETGVAETAMDAGNAIGDANSFVQECSGLAGSIIPDPIGWLVSNGLDIVLELVTPLQDALNEVTGDSAALETAAGNFAGIGDGLRSLSDNFVEVADSSLAEWDGEAADAARRKLAEFADGINGIAQHSGHVTDILNASAMVMDVVEDTVKSLISDFVSWLIMTWVPALAASVATAGASVAAAWSVSLARAGITTSRVARTVQRLLDVLEKIANFFDKIKAVLERIDQFQTFAGAGNYMVQGDSQHAQTQEDLAF